MLPACSWIDEPAPAFPVTGKPELVTCPLDGTILPGVTRDSILQLTRSWGQFEVTERHYTIHEVVDAIKEGRVRMVSILRIAVLSMGGGFTQYRGAIDDRSLWSRHSRDRSTSQGHLLQRSGRNPGLLSLDCVISVALCMLCFPQEHAVPLDTTDPSAKSGKLAKKLMDSIMEIQVLYNRG